MTKLIASRISAFAVVALLATTSVGSAAITVTFNSVESGLGTTVRLDGSSALGAYRGGISQWRQNSQGVPGGSMPIWNSSGSFSTTDFVSISLGLSLDVVPGAQTTRQATALAGSVAPLAASYIAELWQNHMHELASIKGSSLGSKVFRDPRREFIGAMQIAVWKLAFDQGLNFSLTSGRLTAADAADTRLAQTWLNELQAEGITGAKANLAALTSVGSTPQIVELAPQVTIQPLVAQPVPEPGAIVIWGCAIAVGLVATRRRKRG